MMEPPEGGLRVKLKPALSVLLVCMIFVAVLLTVSGGGKRKVQLLSAIDEYLAGKYGAAEPTSFGKLKDVADSAYAGTQGFAKDFGLSDNDPLVRKWDEDKVTDSLSPVSREALGQLLPKVWATVAQAWATVALAKKYWEKMAQQSVGATA